MCLMKPYHIKHNRLTIGCQTEGISVTIMMRIQNENVKISNHLMHRSSITDPYQLAIFSYNHVSESNITRERDVARW